jgi:hypothetical protein
MKKSVAKKLDTVLENVNCAPLNAHEQEAVKGGFTIHLIQPRS